MNVITFAGNLTEDPTLEFAGSTPVVEIDVAVNRRVKDGEEWKDAPATFHRVKVWGKPAENLCDSVGRGDRVIVHGTIETEAWEKDGQRRTKDIVVVSERSGEIGPSFKYAAARVEKRTRTSSEG